MFTRLLVGRAHPLTGMHARGRRRMIPVGSLEPYPGNPRVHDVAAIRESLIAHGQYRPVLAQHRTRRVIAGNGVVEAARELGWARLDVIELDVSDDQATRILTVDNRTSDLATYDEVVLRELLATFDEDLAGTGFSAEALAELADGLPDFAPDEEPVARLDRKSVTTCPNCGHEFTPTTRTVTADG